MAEIQNDKGKEAWKIISDSPKKSKDIREFESQPTFALAPEGFPPIIAL